MCRIDLIRPFFFQQWFPKATTTTSWKSTSREASGWTTRKPVPSSCPSVCPWMTILQRPWETSGCRSNPSPLPVRPRLQAAQVLLIPRLTATARASPTKRLPEACRQFPAIGLSTENQEMLPVWGEYGLYNVKTFHWVQLRLWKRYHSLHVTGWAMKCRSASDLRRPKLESHWCSEECSENTPSVVVSHFCLSLVDTIWVTTAGDVGR